MLVRRLSSSDVVAYRRIRLLGFLKNPKAFGSSYSDEVKRPLKAFLHRLKLNDNTWTFGAFEDDRLVGVVSLVREEGPKERHKASIYGMFVDARYRRKGMGRELIRRAIKTARQLRGLRQVRLTVAASNRPALELYGSFGFKIYGRESAALFVGKRYYSELYLVRRITQAKP
jgi:ribosomal protein S18 acetylase RimI-like enzyme